MAYKLYPVTDFIDLAQLTAFLKNMKRELPEKLLGFIEERRANCWLVGGTIRDILLNNRPKDYDLLFAGITPRELKEKLPEVKKGGKCFAVFLYKGVEITLISQQNLLLTELSRRDFTINALALNLADKQLRDPQGGLMDLQTNKIQVMPGALKEDPCRLYRGARIVAEKPDFNLTKLTCSYFSAVEGENLLNIAKERVYQELHYVLLAPRPEKFFAILESRGVINYHFPGLAEYYSKSGQRVANLQRLSSRLDLLFAALTWEMAQENMAYIAKWDENITIPGAWIRAVRLAVDNLNTLRNWQRVEAVELVDMVDRIKREKFSLQEFIYLAVAEDLRKKRTDHQAKSLAHYEKLKVLIAEMEESITGQKLLTELEPGPELGRELRLRKVAWLAERL